ncbi:unnamed protein product [Closterium sp. NIES-54]
MSTFSSTTSHTLPPPLTALNRTGDDGEPGVGGGRAHVREGGDRIVAGEQRPLAHDQRAAALQGPRAQPCRARHDQRLAGTQPMSSL